MSRIKERRLKELTLASHPGLAVGACVPFYFCPRSVMLYVLHRGNSPGLTYGEGQGPLIHLEADLHRTVAWAEEKDLRWAFTLTNAGAHLFEDRSDLRRLGEINWSAVAADRWGGPFKEGKQAEFLLERGFPWKLVERVGVLSPETQQRVQQALEDQDARPEVQLIPDWYYQD